MDEKQLAPPAGAVQTLDFLPDKNEITPEQTPVDNAIALPDDFSALENVYHSASKADPERAAQVINLSNKVGESEQFVDNNLDALKKTAAAPSSSFFSDLEQNYPGTTKYLSDPRIMAATHDDIENLPKHEGLIQKFKDAGNFIGSAAETGALQEELAFLRYGQLFGGDEVKTDYFRLGGAIASARGATTNSAAQRVEQINKRIGELSANEPKDFGLKKGLYGAIQFVPQIAGGVEYGAKYGVPAGLAASVAGPAASTIATGLGFTAGEAEYNYKLMTGLSYDGLLKVKDVNGNPLPQNVMQITSIAMGSATAGLSFVKLGALLDTIPGGKEFLGKFSATVGEKVLSEPQTYSTALKGFAKTYASSVAHGVAAMEGITAVNILGTEAAKGASPGTFEHPTIGQVATEFGHTAVESALTFGVLGLPGTSVGLGRGLLEGRRTQQTKEFYLALGDTAKNSKLRERLPGEYKQYLDTVTEDMPPVRISVEALNEYFKSKDIDTKTAVDEMGVGRAYDEAVATGEKVQIPLSVWTEKLVGTEHFNALADDISIHKEDGFENDFLSVNEYNQKRAEIKAGAEKAASQVEATAEEQAKAEQEAAHVESGKQVYSEVSNLLRSAGLSEKEIAVNPSLQEAFFRTLGQSLGQDPYELFKQFPLSVNNVPAGFEGAKLEDLRSLTGEHLKSPEAAIQSIGTRERAEQLESMLTEQAFAAQERIDAAGGRDKASVSDTSILSTAGKDLAVIRAVKERLPSEKEFNQASKKDRLARAEAAGFDTKTVYFHGTPNADITEFSRSTNGGMGPGVYFSTDPEFASQYAGFTSREIQRYQNTEAFKKDFITRMNAYEASGLKRQEASSRAFKEATAAYASQPENSGKFGGNVIPVFLRSEKIIDLKDEAALAKLYEKVGVADKTGLYEKVAEFGEKNKTEEKTFNKFLEAQGYEGARSGHELVIFDPKNVRSINAEFQDTQSPLILSQSDKDKKIGVIQVTGNKFNIKFFEGADKSTWIHESGHSFLEVLIQSAEKLKGKENLTDGEKRVVDQAQKWLDWFGVKSSSEIKTPQHEKFAEAFEKYTSEGIAPTPELQGAFSTFKNWFLSLYKELKNIYPDVKLDPEVRAMFDRLLATDEEINRAQEAVGYADEVSKIAPEQAKSIQEMQMRARSLAEETLLKEQMPETTKEHQKFLATERERLTELAKEEVSKQPIFVAAADLKETAGNPYEVARKFLSGKLREQNIIRMEVAAELNGFADGADLARQLVEADELGMFDKAVAGRIEDGMAQHADLKDTPAIRTKALEAIHNERSTDLLALESQILSKMVLQDPNVRTEVSNRKRVEARVEAQFARESAREILANKPVKESTKSSSFVTAERNAAVRVSKALAKKDFEAAAKAKREQLLNHALASEAMRNEKEATRKLDYLKDLAGRGRNLEEMPYGFIRQVDNILSRFGLKEPSAEDTATYKSIAQGMLNEGRPLDQISNATGFTIDEKSGALIPESLAAMLDRVNENYYTLSVPNSVLNETPRLPEDLKLSELRELHDAVKAIATAGKKFERFLGAFEKADIKQAAADFKSSVVENVGTPYAEKKLVGKKNTSLLREKLDPILELPDAIIGDMVNLLTLSDFLDARDVNGKAKEYIYRPLKHAEDRKLARYEKMTEAVNSILENHYDKNEFSQYKNQKFLIESLNRKLTKEEILSMALNWGNEGNKERLRMGLNLNDAQIEVIFEHLNKNDWDFAQDIWDHLNTYWADIVALEERVNGVTPKSVEAVSFENKHGKYRGGYYPIAYDFEKSSEAYKNAQEKSALYKQVSTSHAQTDNGHTKMRADTVKRPLRLSTDVLFNHLENIVHDLEFREPVIDVSRFLQQGDVKSSIENAIGIKGYKAIGDHLRAVARDQGEHLSGLDKFLNTFRFGATYSTLAFRAFSLPMDYTGNIINALSEIGPKRLLTTMNEYRTGRSEIDEFAHDKSERMRHRATLRDRDIKDLSKNWQGKTSALNLYGFMFQRLADEAVSIPLWHEVYQHHVAEHGEKKAVDIADEAVVRTVGSGSALDQVGAQRGGEAKKVFSMFYSWSSMMFNRAWIDGKIAGLEYSQGNVGTAIGIIAKTAAYGWLAQSLNENFWRELVRNKKKDDENAMAKRIAVRTVLQPFGYVWIGKDIASYVVDKATGSPNASYKFSPLESAIQNTMAPFADAAHIAFSHNRHFDQKFSEEVARSASTFLGYPQAANSLVFNFMDFLNNNGELTWRDLLQRRTKN